MIYQINLYSNSLRRQKLYFSLRVLLLTLLGCGLLGAWPTYSWMRTLEQSGVQLQAQLDLQARELESAKASLLQNTPGSGSLATSVAAQLLVQRAQVQAQGQQLAELQRGQIVPGQGYAARLTLIANSIPANVWITDISADAGRLELGGFTLAPSAIDKWQTSLAASPLLKGQSLAAIRVEKAKESDSLKASSSAPPLWTFTLKSAPVLLSAGSQL